MASVWENNCRIQIFARGTFGWEIGENFPVSFDQTKLIPFLCGETAGVAEKPRDAKILIGRAVSGMAYQIFDRMSFHVVEADHCISLLLDRIRSKIEEAERKEDESATQKNARPQETKIPGQYFLNLTVLQQRAPDVSSKMALPPLFDSTPFDRLTVLCQHLPPWLTPYANGKGWCLENGPAKNGAQRVTVVSCCRS
jgi:hypothetical protein